MFDVIIFGGGVIGCATLNKLTRKNLKCLLIEKELDVATGASKANSGLIHAGFDAESGTLKAKLNVEGAAIIPKLARDLGIPYKQTGAVVVGNDEEKLKTLLMRGKKNGVKGLSLLDFESLHKLIPNLKQDIKRGLYAKSAGIISPYMLTIGLCEEAIINGAKVKLGYEAKTINYASGVFSVSDGNESFEAKQIVNSCGAGYNEIAKLLGENLRPIKLRRGEYYVLDSKEEFVPMSVFPLPTEKGKGILATPTIDGNTLFGPTSDDVPDYNLKTTTNGLKTIKESIASMFVSYPTNMQIREFSGIRVSLGNDFNIEVSPNNNNIVNLIGINSPGLSSAPAIANRVAKLLGYERIKDKRMTPRLPYTDISKLSTEQKNVLINSNPDYGKIVCRCELVSVGEIKEAINSPLHPTTVDGIKRRVRAGMGRCQGSFCGLKVASLLAENHHTELNKVVKETKNSFIMPYNIKETDNDIKL